MVAAIPGEPVDREGVADRVERLGHHDEGLLLHVDDPTLAPGRRRFVRGARHVQQKGHRDVPAFGQAAGVDPFAALPGDPPLHHAADHAVDVELFAVRQAANQRTPLRTQRLERPAEALDRVPLALHHLVDEGAVPLAEPHLADGDPPRLVVVDRTVEFAVEVVAAHRGDVGVLRDAAGRGGRRGGAFVAGIHEGAAGRRMAIEHRLHLGIRRGLLQLAAAALGLLLARARLRHRHRFAPGLRLVAEFSGLGLGLPLLGAGGLRVDARAELRRLKGALRVGVVSWTGQPLAALGTRRLAVFGTAHQPFHLGVVGLDAARDVGDRERGEVGGERLKRRDGRGHGRLDGEGLQAPEPAREHLHGAGRRRFRRGAIAAHRRADGAEIAGDTRVFFADAGLHPSVFEELEQLSGEALVGEGAEPTFELALALAGVRPAARRRLKVIEVEVEGPELQVARAHGGEHPEHREVPFVAELLHPLGEVDVVAVGEGAALTRAHLHVLAAVGAGVQREGARDVRQRNAGMKGLDRRVGGIGLLLEEALGPLRARGVERHALLYEAVQALVVERIHEIREGAGEHAEGLGAFGGGPLQELEVHRAPGGGDAGEVVGDGDGHDAGELPVHPCDPRDQAAVGFGLGEADALADRGAVAVPGAERGGVGADEVEGRHHVAEPTRDLFVLEEALPHLPETGGEGAAEAAGWHRPRGSNVDPVGSAAAAAAPLASGRAGLPARVGSPPRPDCHQRCSSSRSAASSSASRRPR